MTEPKDRKASRPDTSKNGLLKKNKLRLANESARERGRQILSRLGKARQDQQEEK